MSEAKKDDYYSGMDIKSLGINFATTMLFFLPMVCYKYGAYWQECSMFTVASLAFAFILPPVGWRRPHPYSDDPNNLPWPRKSE